MEDGLTGRSRGSSRRLWLLAIVGLALAVVGIALQPSGADDPPVVTAAEEPSATRGAGPFVVEPNVRMKPAKRPAKAMGRPNRLLVPRLGVDAPVIGIGVVDGVLLPPSDPQTLGWWSDGAKPGALRGGALITGHTVHSGGGAFDNLETLRRGDRVAVRTDKGLIRYAVTGVTVYRKQSLAKDAEKVFSQTVPGRLVLITCEDWNGSGYDSNAIVFAQRISA
jgi:LPXTG-site transpeptidase (sortase) family protein